MGWPFDVWEQLGQSLQFSFLRWLKSAPLGFLRGEVLKPRRSRPSELKVSVAHSERRRWRNWFRRERIAHSLPTLPDQLLPQIDGVECVLNRFKLASCFDKPGLELKEFEFRRGETAGQNLLGLFLSLYLGSAHGATTFAPMLPHH